VTINKVIISLIIAAVIPLSGCQKYYSMARNLTNASGANGSLSGSVGNGGRSSSRVSTTVSGSISASF
jgi:hypothetical protein